MIKTELCDLLGIKYPVFQGGMAWIADGKLAAAVSEGGGLGIVAAGNADAEQVREQIHIAKSLTNTVVMVSDGYPETYGTGKVITGLENVMDSIVFHAGTKKMGETTLTAGSRVY